MSWVALSLILLASFLLGWLITAQFLPTDPQTENEKSPAAGVELLFAALVAGLALLGYLALLLAQLAVFSAPLLLLLALLLAIPLLLRKRTRPATRATLNALRPWSKESKVELLILAGWMVAAGWLFFRPHEYILGAADAGVYVNQAANISMTAGITFDDPFLAELDPALIPVFLRAQPPSNGTEYYLFPGFNVANGRTDRIIPDFYPLHPVWQAVAFDIGGVWAALRLPGLWALLGSLAVYFALRQVVGWRIALLGLAGITLNALQLWFARYPVAETLTGLLLWSSLWAHSAWLVRRGPAKMWAFLAGITLGGLFLVRIDTIFLLAIPLLLALWLFFFRPPFSRSELVCYFAPLGILLSQAVLHALFISTPYARRVIAYGMRTLTQIGLLLPLLVALLVAAGLGIIAYRYRVAFAESWPGWWSRVRRPVLLTGSILILLLGVYGWFVRPAIGSAGSYQDWWAGSALPTYDHENLVRLGWYLSPVGVWLGIAGMVLLFWRGNRRTIVILAAGLFFSLLYLWRIQVNQHQIYAMRRYVPVVMPFFVFAAVFFLAWLMQGKRRSLRIAGVGLAVLWLFGLGWSARGFISQVDYRGLIAEMAALDDALPAHSILIFNDQALVGVGDILGTPLRYLYGHDVLTLREPGEADTGTLLAAMREWQAAGRAIYWIGDAGFLDANGIEYASREAFIPAVYLEGSYEHKPSAIVNSGWTLELHALDEIGAPE